MKNGPFVVAQDGKFQTSKPSATSTSGTDMIDNNGHIKNPLTVISRFAAIAEISGTAVLPFIEPENQAIYIWFLMLFPVLLVGIFFLTLNFNHKTLYAPSDYKNQNHFLNLFGIVTPDERDEKLEQEVGETVSPVASVMADDPPPEQVPALNSPAQEASATSNDKSEETAADASVLATREAAHSQAKPESNTFDLDAFAKKSLIESMAKLEYIEKRSIEQLKATTNIAFSEHVKFDIPGLSKPIIFDAVADQNETIHIAEVKFFENGAFSIQRFSSTFANAKLVAKQIYQLSNRKILLHLVVILGTPASEGTIHNIKTVLRNNSLTNSMSARIYIATVDELTSGQMPNTWPRQN